MRELNRRLLVADVDPDKVGTQAAWDDITRLRGPRTRRLREILDQGADLGLMRLRPVWLMSPDVASRVRPFGLMSPLECPQAALRRGWEPLASPALRGSPPGSLLALCTGPEWPNVS